MNTWGKILCVSWRLQDCTHLPRLTGLFQADDAPFSKQRPRCHFWHMTCCLQESWSQHRANLMTSSSTTFTCCRLKTVFLRESTATSAAPSSAAATVAEDAEMRTLFQLHTVQLPSQKACKWKDDQTWSLVGECTIFSLHCNTHRQSLAKDNTCMHNLVPCVHTHIYVCIHINSGQLLSCSSLGRSVPRELNVYKLLGSYQHETFLFLVVIKTRRHKERIPAKAVLLTFWNHLLVMCVCRCLKAVISC